MYLLYYLFTFPFPAISRTRVIPIILISMFLHGSTYNDISVKSQYVKVEGILDATSTNPNVLEKIKDM